VPLNFTAIDFETANSSSASPCAVGLVKVVDGKVVDSWATLMRPPMGFGHFDPMNIRVHGIQPEQVGSAPSAPEAFADMLDWINGDIMVAHNAAFDMGVIRATLEVIGRPIPNLEYACSLSVARQTYKKVGGVPANHRLSTMAELIGIQDFNHHDALADADACARLMLHAANRHDAESLADLLKATKQVLKPLAKD
jgi:DNA polymerase-3 subunit epsilon